MRRKLFSLLIFLCAAIPAGAQQAEKSVAAAVENLRSAMISGDRTQLDAIASDKLSYGHSGGNVQNKAEFVEAIASGKSDFVSIDLTGQTITVDGDVALVRHVLSAKTNDDQQPGQVKLAVLLVWKLEKGNWKLLARQAVKPAG